MLLKIVFCLNKIRKNEFFKITSNNLLNYFLPRITRIIANDEGPRIHADRHGFYIRNHILIRENLC